MWALGVGSRGRAYRCRSGRGKLRVLEGLKEGFWVLEGWWRRLSARERGLGRRTEVKGCEQIEGMERLEAQVKRQEKERGEPRLW